MKTGLLTFHRVYNYGAVIQAYALQQILFSIGCENEIIDYSEAKQIDYTSLYSTRNGFKRFSKALPLIPLHAGRLRRQKRFDAFFREEMTLSSRTFTSIHSLADLDGHYSAFLTGSDQVWNVRKKSDTSSAYFLHFADAHTKKVAYAPGIGTCSEKDLLPYREDLLRFDSISCRENGGAQILSRLLEKEVPVVLDPTLLADCRIFERFTQKTEECPYLLYYSLDGFDRRRQYMDLLRIIGEKFGLRVKLVTPEWPYHSDTGESIVDAGPKEFLTLLKNASLVCTNSFHGTALSISLRVPVFVLEPPFTEDERKRNLLSMLGIQNRRLCTMEELDIMRDYRMNYKPVTEKVEMWRKKSVAYLYRALELSPPADNQ